MSGQLSVPTRVLCGLGAAFGLAAMVAVEVNGGMGLGTGIAMGLGIGTLGSAAVLGI
jgi:hypothetical protein